ncbi:hypothetical protein Tco_0966526 [Tanacetum coccineum]
MNENEGKMPTKIKLTLEQSQQGVSDDVLIRYLCKTLKMSEAENHPPALSVTTLLDDWSIEIDADHVDLGQDRLGVFD